MRNEPIVLFDGVCNLCNTVVNTIVAIDNKKKIKFASLQSKAGQFLVEKFQIQDSIDSIILVDNNKFYTHSSAAIRVVSHLGFLGSLAKVFLLVPTFIRDNIYKLIARNRYRWFGKSESCRIPSEKEKDRFIEIENV